jgi:hypothetical protein
MHRARRRHALIEEKLVMEIEQWSCIVGLDRPQENPEAIRELVTDSY